MKAIAARAPAPIRQRTDRPGHSRDPFQRGSGHPRDRVRKRSGHLRDPVRGRSGHSPRDGLLKLALLRSRPLDSDPDVEIDQLIAAHRRLELEGLTPNECGRLVTAWLRAMAALAAGHSDLVHELDTARELLARHGHRGPHRERFAIGVCA